MTRSEWERDNPDTLALAQATVFCLNRKQVAAGRLILSYNKEYVGLTCQGKPLNFVIFMPKGRGKDRGGSYQPRCPRREDLDREIRNAALEPDYRSGNGRNRYALKLSAAELDQHGALVLKLARLAYSHHHPGRLPGAGKSRR